MGDHAPVNHSAITGKTAAELISERADADKPNMGLTSWKGVKVGVSHLLHRKKYDDQNTVRYQVIKMNMVVLTKTYKFCRFKNK